VTSTPLVKSLGVPLDRGGRVIVEPDLSIPGHPDIFVIGDLMHFAHGLPGPLPGVAQVAMQSGARAAKNIRADVDGTARRPFKYLDLGSFAVIGRTKAVAIIFGIPLSGLIAWLAWAFVHVMSLIPFRSRAVVFIKWAWAYLVWDASARLVWQGERSRAGVLAAGGIDLDEASVQDPKERTIA
jgi:NADH dehydrogenase